MSITTTAAVHHETVHQVEARKAPVKVEPVRAPVRVEQKHPIVVSHDNVHAGDKDRGPDNDRGRDNDRDRDHDRPIVIVQPVVHVITPVTYQSPYSTGYVYAPAPQPLTVLGATALDGGELTTNVTAELGGMCQLDLANAGTGGTYVDSVVLTYGNGAQQTVAVNQLIDAANPQFQIQLPADAGALANVSVVGHSNWGGAVAITAR
jgi:hypothetical protein|nr:hypothetical protein [Kofleriaceae bacterium]